MRYSMIFIILWVILICHLPLPVCAEQTQSPSDNDVHFIWSFGAIKNTQNSKFVPVSEDMTLETGDKIKFLIELKEKCFVYLLYHSSQDELSALFPFRFNSMQEDYPALERFYIPEGVLWFELDKHLGKETIYLLASDSRLTDLENLINIYESTDETKKKTISQKIISKIKALRKQHTDLRAAPERPINIAGNKRSVVKTINTDIDHLLQNAVEIKADNFYFRTYTIDHK